jgi:hypothetical protein
VTAWAQALVGTLIVCGVIATTSCLIRFSSGREQRRHDARGVVQYFCSSSKPFNDHILSAFSL